MTTKGRTRPAGVFFGALDQEFSEPCVLEKKIPQNGPRCETISIIKGQAALAMGRHRNPFRLVARTKRALPKYRNSSVSELVSCIGP